MKDKCSHRVYYMVWEEVGKLFTVEMLTLKGWDVIKTSNSLNEILNWYRDALLEDGEAILRLTSPTDIVGTYGRRD